MSAVQIKCANQVSGVDFKLTAVAISNVSQTNNALDIRQLFDTDRIAVNMQQLIDTDKQCTEFTVVV